MHMRMACTCDMYMSNKCMYMLLLLQQHVNNMYMYMLLLLLH